MRVSRTALVATTATLVALIPTALAETPLIDLLARAGLCLPQSASAGGAQAAARPVRLTGFGTAGLPASRDREAQAWFDQGVATGWAFSHREHLRAMQEAQRLDPACGLCAWGEAMALGPTINFDVDPAKRRQALAALDRAAARAASATPLQRELIAVARLRFAEPDLANRRAANRAYAEAMERLAAANPADDAVAVLAVDALMVAHDGVGDVGPAAGEAAAPGNAGLRRAERLLERVMARSPDHTGALHFYIHLTEWLNEAGKAEAAADRLGPLAPAAGHLVHMPSHTYGRIGRWADAARVNRLAADADTALARATGLPAAREVPYHAHNMHFRTISALGAGDRPEAVDAARDWMAEYPLASTGAGWPEVMAASALYVHGRYATAADIAALPQAPADRLLLQASRRYALGEAAARVGDRRTLAREIAALRDVRRRLGRGGAFGPRTGEHVDMLRLVLEGRAAGLDRRWSRAADAYRRAAAIQARTGVAGDPPTFWFPIRRAEGQALLRAGRLPQAREALTASLRAWPRDAVGLAALAELETRARRPAEAGRLAAESRRWWSGDAAALTPDAI